MALKKAKGLTLDNARMPTLKDKIRDIEAKAESKREKLEKKDAEEEKIIKKSARKN